MAKARFKISQFTNPGGDNVWRLAGTLNGERIRKNFRSRDEAVAERQRYEIRHLNEASNGQTVWTTLTHDENRDAIAAVNQLKQANSSKTLSFAVDYLLSHYKEERERLPIEDVVGEYLSAKAEELERGLIRGRQKESIDFELLKLSRHFQNRIIGEIQADELTAYLRNPLGRSKKIASPKTWNNRRGYLSAFFKYCLAKKYIGEDPVPAIPILRKKISRGTAATLDARKSCQLMKWLESYRGQQNKDGSWWGNAGCMVPYFALCLFAGIRPDWKDGEIGKLMQSAIRNDTEVIIIEPDVAKEHEKRTIKIQPNLKLWLQKYPLDQFPLTGFKRFKHMLKDVRVHFDLGHDMLRHTFISMTVGAFRSVGEAALQAGNSESVVRKHYLDLKSVEEADQFWRIIPHGTKLPEVLEKKDGRYIPQVVESGKE